MSSDAARVLIVEDERQMQRFLRTAMTARGYRVREAVTVAEAVAASTENPDIILLDLGLPDGSGMDVLRRVREWSRVPVIVLSARGRDDDKVAALDAGADDYLTKPFSVDELLARIRVALRHAERARAARDEPVLELQNLRIDFARREVTVDGRMVHLTPTEYRLLTLLAQNAGRVLTHRQIIREVWGTAYVAHTHYVRVHMAELRKKIEADPARPRLLLTEAGVGYRLHD